MNNRYISYAFQFLMYVLVQVLVLNGIDYMQVATPFLFILFILGMPNNMGRIPLMLVSFLLGFTVDIFSNTTGCHAAACVLIAYFKPFVAHFFGPIDDSIVEPSFRTFGRLRFMEYAFSLVMVHHLVFYMLENGSFVHMGAVFFRTLQSGIFTLVLIYFVQYIQFKHSR